MADIIARSSPIIATSGTYTGDDTANRAIPHGLGRVPLNIHWQMPTNNVQFVEIAASGEIQKSGVAAALVTPPDSINFYVGTAGAFATSANAAGIDYRWSAV